MASQPDTRTTVLIDPVTHTKEVHTEYRESSAGWWTAAIIALVLIVGGLFLLTGRQTQDDQALIDAAIDQGRTQGLLEGAQTPIDSVNASAERAADATAANAARAAEDARAAAERAAASAADAAATASNRAAQTMTSGPPPAVQ